MKRLLLLFIILISIGVKAQYTPMTAWGYDFTKRLKAANVQLGSDTTTYKHGIAQVGTKLFIYHTSAWNEIGGTTIDSNRLVKYTDTASMLLAYKNALNTKVTTGSEAVLTGVKASTSAGISIKANNGTEVAHFGAGSGVNANIANLSIGTAIAFNNKRLADTTDIANFATTSSVNAALALKVNNTDTANILLPYLRKNTFIDSLIARNAARTNVINSFTTRQNFTSLWVNKDSLPRTTGRIWAVYVDTVTGQLVRQTISAGGVTGSGTANQLAIWNGTSSLTGNSNFVIDASNRMLLGGITNDNSTRLQVGGAIKSGNSTQGIVMTASSNGGFIDAFADNANTTKTGISFNSSGGRVGFGAIAVAGSFSNTNNTYLFGSAGAGGGGEFWTVSGQNYIFNSATGIEHTIRRNSSIVNQGVGTMYQLFNAASNPVDYAFLGAGIESNTTGNHTGFFRIFTATAGNITEKVRVNSGGELLIGLTTANNSSILTTSSTTRGSMPYPRMTQAQRLAITVGASQVGLHVYQTDGTEGVYVYKSTGWAFAY